MPASSVFVSHSIRFTGSKKKKNTVHKKAYQMKSYVFCCAGFCCSCRCCVIVVLCHYMIIDYCRNLYPILFWHINHIKKTKPFHRFNSHKIEQRNKKKTTHKRTPKKYESKKKSKCVTYSGVRRFFFLLLLLKMTINVKDTVEKRNKFK